MRKRPVVVDAKFPLHFKITAEDIEEAKKNNPTGDVITIALRKALGEQMSKAKNQTEKVPVVNAVAPLFFNIEQKHILLAKKILADTSVPKCDKPGCCVVAQSLMDALGGLFEAIEIGSEISKIVQSDKITRYRTGRPLRDAIRTFDATGDWYLPTGRYCLGALPKYLYRWDKKGKAKHPQPGRPQSIFRGRRILGRHVTNSQVLAARVAAKKKK